MAGDPRRDGASDRHDERRWIAAQGPSQRSRLEKALSLSPRQNALGGFLESPNIAAARRGVFRGGRFAQQFRASGTASRHFSSPSAVPPRSAERSSRSRRGTAGVDPSATIRPSSVGASVPDPDRGTTYVHLVAAERPPSRPGRCRDRACQCVGPVEGRPSPSRSTATSIAWPRCAGSECRSS